MIHNTLRIGNFTSSEIVALHSVTTRDMTEDELKAHKEANPKSKKTKTEHWPGPAAVTYIQECNFERRLGRSITDESTARPLTWGKLLEGRAFDQLGLEYILISDQTSVHPLYSWWAGSTDGEKGVRDIEMQEGADGIWRRAPETVIDIKCPMTLKSFCQLVQPIYEGLTGMDAMNALRNGFTDKNGLFHKEHKDGEKYYWQIVSNACIRGAKYGELVVYMPYQSELDEIRMMVNDLPADQMSKHTWIAFALEDELPYIKDDGFYKSLNVIRFEIPQEDKDLLTRRVLEGGKLLIEWPDGLV